MILRANCKINLGLDILRRRAELIAAGARHLVDRPGELLELL